MSELRPLPNEQDYLEATARVEERFAEKGRGPKLTLLAYGTGAPSIRNFANIAATFGRLIEPKDRSTGEYIDPDHRVARAFYLGSLAGLMVAREAHGTFIMPSKIFEAVPPVAIQFDPDDKADTQFRIAERFIERGNEGLKILGHKAEDRLEEWEILSVQDVTRSRMFRIACGLVTLGSRAIHADMLRQHDREEMENLAAMVHDFDWDAGLSSLTNE